MFFFKNYFALYNLFILYSFLGLGHISLGIFFVKVCIIKLVIRLMDKYNLDFYGFAL
jgi:hypothetical protein